MGEKEKGKSHNRFPTMHAHRQRREKTTKNVYSTSVRSAALPGTEASNFTYTKIQRKTTEGTREKINGTQEHRQIKSEKRMKKKRGRETGARIWDLRVKGVRGGSELLVLRL